MFTIVSLSSARIIQVPATEVKVTYGGQNYIKAEDVYRDH
jgi:hypothetical protein